MSLVVAVKGTEGVVLAADSRLTLNIPQPGQGLLNVTFDNATKFLAFNNPHHKWVAAGTYGDSVIGNRTIPSFVPELELSLRDQRKRISEYAEQISDFFRECWEAEYGPDRKTGGMWFIVGGYDNNEPYGAVYDFNVPNSPEPVARYVGNNFGMRWGGQYEMSSRIILGHDPSLIRIIKDSTNLDESQVSEIRKNLASLEYKIPYSVLPLQDCIDLATFLIRATMTVQDFASVSRGVGGTIEVASITREHGLVWVQKKQLHGETQP